MERSEGTRSLPNGGTVRSSRLLDRAFPRFFSRTALRRWLMYGCVFAMNACFTTCFPPALRHTGPLGAVMDSTFGVHPALSCRSGSSYPAECLSGTGDTLAFVYTDTSGIATVVGQEWSLPEKSMDAAHRKLRDAFSLKYGRAQVCSQSGQDQVLGWQGKGFAVVLEPPRRITSDTAMIRWGWIAGLRPCPKLSDTPRFM